MAQSHISAFKNIFMKRNETKRLFPWLITLATMYIYKAIHKDINLGTILLQVLSCFITNLR